MFLSNMERLEKLKESIGLDKTSLEKTISNF